jgi:hypothetical protein
MKLYNKLIAMTNKQPKHYLLVSYYFFPNSSMKHIKIKYNIIALFGIFLDILISNRAVLFPNSTQ